MPAKTDPGASTSSLSQTQLNNAKTIVSVGKALGMNDNAIVSALAVANDESTFQNYANSNVPESMKLSHDAVGADHDSVGVFQQRAGSEYGWGKNISQLMDVKHQAAAYFGGTPNSSAAGVLQQKNPNADPGSLAQQVQQSATPQAYKPLVSFGKQLLSKLAGTPPAHLDFSPRATGPNFQAANSPAGVPAQAPLRAAPPPTPPKNTYIPQAPAAAGAGFKQANQVAKPPPPAPPPPTAPAPGIGGGTARIK